MKRILFVDDDPNILNGLSRSLRPQRDRWEMEFAAGGEPALALLAARPFDVVVSDMRMPGMDGAAFLARCAEAWPQTVRMVLTGHTELDAAMKTVTVAHQFLTKPCEPNRLRETIDRTLSLHTLLKDEEIRRVIGQVKQLPPLPAVYSQLSAALADPNASARDIAAIITRDVGMTAKILQIVNSAFFGLPRQLADITSAVTYLGSLTIRQLTLSAGVFRNFETCRFPAGFALETEQSHALATSRLTALLAPRDAPAGEGMTAGMLHDLGHLVLAAHFGDRYDGVAVTSVGARARVESDEQRGTGVTHAEVGGYLLGLWGLPYSLVEAVAYHHRPEALERSRFDLVAAVHVADRLADRFPDLGKLPPDELPRWMAEEALEDPVLDERVPGWREAVRAAGRMPAMRS